MTIGDAEKRGLLAVGATAATAGTLAIGLNQGWFRGPPLQIIPIILSTTAFLLALVAFWYLVGQRWESIFPPRRGLEAPPGPEAGTLEAFLRLADSAESLLQRLIGYARTLFFVLVMAIILTPLLLSIALSVAPEGGVLFPVLFLVVVVPAFAAYAYLSSDIRRQYNAWTEKLAWLRSQQEVLFESQRPAGK